MTSSTRISNVTRNLGHTSRTTAITASRQQVAGMLPPLFTSIRRHLPQNVTAIDDLQIKGDRVTVKYHVPNAGSGESPTGNLPVAVENIDILRLDDGRLIEHYDNVYQVRS